MAYAVFDGLNVCVGLGPDGSVVATSTNVGQLWNGSAFVTSPYLIGQHSATDQDSLQAALEAYGEAYVPPSADFVVDDLVMPANSKIHGTGLIRWLTSSTATRCISLQTNCVIQGVRFEPDVDTSVSKTILYGMTGSSNVGILDCVITGHLNGSFGAYEKLIYLEQGCLSPKIIRNKTQYGSEAIMASYCQKGIFQANEINAPAGAGFRFYGGKYNTIANNKVYGRNQHGSTYAGRTVAGQSTVAGVNFLTFGFLGSNRGIIGNIISGNEFYGISEEAIGLDTHGNVANDSAENPTLPVGTFQSLVFSGQNQVITLQEATTLGAGAAAATWAQQCYVIFLTGAAAGFMAPVISSTSSASANTATLTIPRNMGDLAASAGDKMLITYGIIDNIISDNIVRNSAVGVSLWGSCWNNLVDNNDLVVMDIGIQVAAVIGGAVVAGANADGTPKSPTLGYSGLNKIKGNGVRLQYDAQPSANTRGNAPIIAGTWAYGAPTAGLPGNLAIDVIDNTFCSARNALIGGSYATTNPGDVTISGGLLAGNRIVGGGVIAISKTDATMLGRNYKVASREDYNVAASSLNTNVVTAA